MLVLVPSFVSIRTFRTSVMSIHANFPLPNLMETTVIIDHHVTAPPLRLIQHRLVLFYLLTFVVCGSPEAIMLCRHLYTIIIINTFHFMTFRGLWLHYFFRWNLKKVLEMITPTCDNVDLVNLRF